MGFGGGCDGRVDLLLQGGGGGVEVRVRQTGVHEHGGIPAGGDDDAVGHELGEGRQGEDVVLDVAVRQKITQNLS